MLGRSFGHRRIASGEGDRKQPTEENESGTQRPIDWKSERTGSNCAQTGCASGPDSLICIRAYHGLNCRLGEVGAAPGYTQVEIRPVVRFNDRKNRMLILFLSSLEAKLEEKRKFTSKAGL